MFKKTVTAAVASATIGLGLMLAVPASASAHDVRNHIGYSHGHGHIELRFGHQPRVHKRKFRHHGICRPGHAVHKAERRGLRKVRVKRVNDRFVVIKGRKHGSKVRVAFYRDSPRCKVAWVKRSNRHGGYRY